MQVSEATYKTYIIYYNEIPGSIIHKGWNVWKWYEAMCSASLALDGSLTSVKLVGEFSVQLREPYICYYHHYLYYSMGILFFKEHKNRGLTSFYWISQIHTEKSL